MKILTRLILAAAFLSLLGGHAYAQCTTVAFTSPYPAATINVPNNNGPVVLAVDCYAGEYSSVTVQIGSTYSVTSTIATDYITITDGAGVAQTFGVQPHVFVATTTAIRIYRHTNGPATCGTQNVNRAITVTCTSCPPALMPPSNDECGSAVNLVVQPFTNATCPGSATGTTVSATKSTVPPSASFGTPSDDDVWYQFTATGTSHAVRFCNVTFVGPVVPMNVALHPGCTAGDVQITGSNSAITITAGTGTGSLTGLTAGNTYKLRVLTSGVGSRANFDISILEAPNSPGCSALVSPANGMTNVPIVNTSLTWAAPVSGGPPAAYDLYFGTVNPPALAGSVSAPATSALLNPLAYSTTYYWYVIPKNAGGSAAGCNAVVYSFTTAAAPAPAFDECAGAVSITNSAAQFVNPGPQSVQGATQSLAPILCNNSTSPSALDVWYSFTTDTDGGDVTIAVVPTTGTDLIVQGFTTAGQCMGASVCADAEVTSGPLTNGGESLTMTGLLPASTYYFRVYRFSSSNTAYILNVTAAGTALPLELKSFTGKVQGSVNLLNWETLTEKNVQFYVVERSVDGARWAEVGRVNGKEDSQVSTKYALTDNAPLARAYYRLRSIDFDGKENLSNYIVLTRKGENFGITSVYPSPTVDNITVQFNATSEEKVTVRVMDMQGRLVMQQVTEAVKDINELPITLTGLQAGVYSVTVSNGTTVSTPVRFVKQ